MEIPGFRIERLIAEGGTASVFLALQESLERKVALKVLREFDNAEQSRRFLHEGQIIAALSHRNIITIHDIGRVADNHYIAMEYLEGGSLADKIAKGMNVPAILDILETIGRCLVVVHGKGIVHRDIKPGNILFHADQTPILTDFGIAKEIDADQDLTVVGGVIGTPSHISPEQARAKHLDGRSDIYSLGIVFYEMLMGTQPYKEDSHAETIVAHLIQPIPLLPPQLSFFQELLQRMIAKEPEERFSTAGELVSYVSGLRVAQRALTVAAQPPSGRHRRQPIRLTAALSPARRRNDLPSDRSWREKGLVRRGAPTLDLLRRAPKEAKAALGVILASTVIGGLFLQSEPEAPPQPPSSAQTGSEARESSEIMSLLSEPATDVGVPGNPTSYERVSSAEDGQTATQPASLSTPSEPQLQEMETAMSQETNSTEWEPWSSVQGEVAAAPSPEVDESREALQPEIGNLPAVEQLLSAAEAALADYRLTTPEEDNAYFYYRKVLELVPDHPAGVQGLVRIADLYASLARGEIDKRRFRAARLYIRRGLGIEPKHSRLLALKVRERRARRAYKPSEPNRQPSSSKPGGYFMEDF